MFAVVIATVGTDTAGAAERTGKLAVRAKYEGVDPGPVVVLALLEARGITSVVEVPREPRLGEMAVVVVTCRLPQTITGEECQTGKCAYKYTKQSPVAKRLRGPGGGLFSHG